MAVPVWQDLDRSHQVILAAALGLALAVVAFVQLKPSTLPLHSPSAFGTLRQRLTAQVRATEAQPAIDPKEWRKFKLVEKITISPNTAMYARLLLSPSLESAFTRNLMFAATASSCPRAESSACRSASTSPSLRPLAAS